VPRLSRFAWVAAVALAAAACTATRTREFTREEYQAPPGARPAPARVFEAPAEEVAAALDEVLRRRGATLVSRSAGGALVARIPWQSGDEARASVDLGRLRRVVTHTQRWYRSLNPLHFRCDDCVVRDGDLTSQTTLVVEDETRPLDADRYRLEAELSAGLAAARSGTRLEIGLQVQVDPRDPPELAPASTGHLEGLIFHAIEASLLR
jgi:hypothetical protein